MNITDFTITEFRDCWVCDRYALIGKYSPGMMLPVCWEHRLMNERPEFVPAEPPFGWQNSWRRGVWA